jgi:hypothetical protein
MVMKNLLFICFSCVSIVVFGQTPKAVEADLLKLFKKINYSSQSNEKANEDFGKKLKFYTEKYPSTINQDFGHLKEEHLDISTSDDGFFRIYSWDTWTGGTMHFFESVLQYRSGNRTVSVLDTPKKEGDNRPNYNKLYSFKTNGKTYYLATCLAIGSTRDLGEGIQIFAIENGKLNYAVKLIKTKTGLHSEVSCEYYSNSEGSDNIYFDVNSKAIKIPLITGHNKIPHKFITYKFTGKYFEKVKS